MLVKPQVNCTFALVEDNTIGAVSGVANIPPNAFNFIEGNLGNKVIARSAVLSSNESGTTRLDVVFANCTDFPLQIEARTQFIDASGIPVERVSGWKRLYLQPRTLSQYQESSTYDGLVNSYLVDVREGY